MAAPNIVNVSSIIGKTQGSALTTSNADQLVCATDKLVKVNSIIVSNVDGSVTADVDVSFVDSSSGNLVLHLAKGVTVPTKSTLIVLGKDAPIYLEEGDKIQAKASAAGDLELVVSFEELDDA
tara:strand:- start:236 stop:604 length:369 start_codon:yes stop_codon:yes gene_type:complete